jgi:hypothetical protein
VSHRSLGPDVTLGEDTSKSCYRTTSCCHVLESPAGNSDVGIEGQRVGLDEVDRSDQISGRLFLCT